MPRALRPSGGFFFCALFLCSFFSVRAHRKIIGEETLDRRTDSVEGF